jgi:RHS repeat-associated protein
MNMSATHSIASFAASASGAILWRESYKPFGETLVKPAANDNRRGYTGHVADSAINLIYMQARYYDPATARFLSPDPIGYQDGLGLYVYVRGDPVNATDPSGTLSFLTSRPVVSAPGGFSGTPGVTSQPVYMNHMFVIVSDCRGCKIQERYSFAPSNGNDGALVSHSATRSTEGGTNRDDIAAWTSLAHGGADGVSASLIDAPDSVVIAAGDAVTRYLGTRDNPGTVDYDVIPTDGANSNSAAYGIAQTAANAWDNARGAPNSPQPLPSRTSNPGWGQWQRATGEAPSSAPDGGKNCPGGRPTC